MSADPPTLDPTPPADPTALATSIPAPVSDRPALLTPDEFRLHFPRIGRGSLYALLRSGRIRHLRIGRKILIPAGEIIAFLQREATGS